MQPLVPPAIASREEWLAARKALLAEEKAATKVLDAVSEKRRQLPWVLVEEDYVFHGSKGAQTLADLFEGRQQLIVHHLMFAPGDTQSCVGCAFQADHSDGPRQHFEHNDTKFVAVSRAPWEDLAPFKKRMGWTFDWVSSAGSSFNYDYGVSFTPEQIAAGNVGYNFGTSPYAFADLPGMSVFVKDAAGKIYHTYSTYARGLDILITTHNLLDLTPGGRDQDEPGPGWLKFHDEYGDQVAPPAPCAACEGETKAEEAAA
jgi:predicted dithiol-disulfide oxidoreductase (DUF899 family)